MRYAVGLGATVGIITRVKFGKLHICADIFRRRYLACLPFALEISFWHITCLPVYTSLRLCACDNKKQVQKVRAGEQAKLDAATQLLAQVTDLCDEVGLADGASADVTDTLLAAKSSVRLAQAR